MHRLSDPIDICCPSMSTRTFYRPPHHVYHRMDPSGPADGYVMEVYENQRKKQPWGWGSGRKRHLRTSDPGRFSDAKGENRLHVKLLDQVRSVPWVSCPFAFLLPCHAMLWYARGVLCHAAPWFGRVVVVVVVCGC